MKELLKLALPLDGDLAECGVFRGASSYLLAKAIATEAPAKQLHLFDSFAGLSQPEAARDGSHWRAGDLACDLAEVAANLENYPEFRVVFHPGSIPDHFQDVGEKKFCFVHIDVDLYEPTRDALAFFGERLMPGGILICDDYGFETCPGARLAMDEYAGAVRKPVVHCPHGTRRNLLRSVNRPGRNLAPHGYRDGSMRDEGRGGKRFEFGKNHLSLYSMTTKSRWRSNRCAQC